VKNCFYDGGDCGISEVRIYCWIHTMLFHQIVQNIPQLTPNISSKSGIMSGKMVYFVPNFQRNSHNSQFLNGFFVNFSQTIFELKANKTEQNVIISIISSHSGGNNNNNVVERSFKYGFCVDILNSTSTIFLSHHSILLGPILTLSSHHHHIMVISSPHYGHIFTVFTLFTWYFYFVVAFSGKFIDSTSQFSSSSSHFLTSLLSSSIIISISLSSSLSSSSSQFNCDFNLTFQQKNQVKILKFYSIFTQ